MLQSREGEMGIGLKYREHVLWSESMKRKWEVLALLMHLLMLLKIIANVYG